LPQPVTIETRPETPPHESPTFPLPIQTPHNVERFKHAFRAYTESEEPEDIECKLFKGVEETFSDLKIMSLEHQVLIDVNEADRKKSKRKRQKVIGRCEMTTGEMLDEHKERNKPKPKKAPAKTRAGKAAERKRIATWEDFQLDSDTSEDFEELEDESEESDSGTLIVNI
jgi:hypothetical protein